MSRLSVTGRPERLTVSVAKFETLPTPSGVSAASGRVRCNGRGGVHLAPAGPTGLASRANSATSGGPVMPMVTIKLPAFLPDSRGNRLAAWKETRLREMGQGRVECYSHALRERSERPA